MKPQRVLLIGLSPAINSDDDDDDDDDDCYLSVGLEIVEVVLLLKQLQLLLIWTVLKTLWLDLLRCMSDLFREI